MQQKIYPILIALTLLLVHCNQKKPDRALVVSKLKSASKLATVEYVVTKVVSSEHEAIIGKNTYFFAETEATIKAGIDLNKLREKDIEIDGSKISITLPPIELINFSYPADAFRIIEKYNYDSKIFTWRNFDIEKRDELYRQSEKSLRANIKDLGIEKTAKNNTIMLLTPIIESVGFKEVYIEFRDSSATIDQSEELKALKEEVEKLRKEMQKQD